MTTARGTPRRSVRVPDERWDRFSAICARRGTNASEALNAHMQTEIDNEQEHENDE